MCVSEASKMRAQSAKAKGSKQTRIRLIELGKRVICKREAGNPKGQECERKAQIPLEQRD